MIVVATEDQDEEEIYYLYGRLTYYIINFDPIEEMRFSTDQSLEEEL